MHRSGLRSRLVAIAGTNHPFATVSGAKRSAAVVACVDGGNSIPHWMHSLPSMEEPLANHHSPLTSRIGLGWVARGPRLPWARVDRTNAERPPNALRTCAGAATRGLVLLEMIAQ